MKFILIAIATIGLKFGSVSVVAEFDDEKACRQALEALSRKAEGVAVCVAKGSKP